MRDPIEEIKSKLDIVDFIGRYVSLKKAGRNFKALCPFHQESTPSFIVSPERQIWHCFGACHDGGDIFKFLMKWENISFTDALKELAKETGVQLTEYKKTFQGIEAKKDRWFYINTLAMLFYKKVLRSKYGKKALAYLKEKRGLNDKVIDKFDIGYAPSSWRTLILFMQKKGVKESELMSVGLVSKSDSGRYYDRFRDRIIFPLKNTLGSIVGFSGRILSTDNKDVPKYINTPETTLYKKREVLFGMDIARNSIRKKGFAIVVEGEFDVISPYQKGIDNIVAIKGSALTREQMFLLKRYANKIYLMLDMDEAGSEAVKLAIDNSLDLDLQLKVVQFEGAKDPDEIAKTNISLFKTSIKKAENIIDFVIDKLLRDFDINDPFGKKRFAEEVSSYLLRIKNPIIKDFYLKKVAGILDIDKNSLVNLLRTKKIKTESKKAYKTEINKDNISGKKMVERYILSYILGNGDVKKKYKKVFSILDVDDFETPSLRLLIDKLGSFLNKNSKFNIKKFIALIPPELRDILDEIYLLSSLTSLSDTENKINPKSIDRSILRFRKAALTRKIKSLYKSDKSNTSDEIKKLINKRKEVEKKLISL